MIEAIRTGSTLWRAPASKHGRRRKGSGASRFLQADFGATGIFAPIVRQGFVPSEEHSSQLGNVPLGLGKTGKPGRLARKNSAWIAAITAQQGSEFVVRTG